MEFLAILAGMHRRVTVAALTRRLIRAGPFHRHASVLLVVGNGSAVEALGQMVHDNVTRPRIVLAPCEGGVHLGWIAHARWLLRTIALEIEGAPQRTGRVAAMDYSAVPALRGATFGVITALIAGWRLKAHTADFAAVLVEVLFFLQLPIVFCRDVLFSEANAWHAARDASVMRFFREPALTLFRRAAVVVVLTVVQGLKSKRRLGIGIILHGRRDIGTILAIFREKADTLAFRERRRRNRVAGDIRIHALLIFVADNNNVLRRLRASLGVGVPEHGSVRIESDILC